MATTDITPVLVAPLDCQVGENPLWHPEAQTLFFVDIFAGTVYAYSPKTESHRLFCKTRVTGGFTFQEDGSLLLFQDGVISLLGLDGHLHEVARGMCPQNERFNDVIADPEGRVYAGAMGGNGRLLRFDTDGSVTDLFDGVGIPNGMGFTPDQEGMYITDSEARRIYHFDYDRKTGNLSNRRVFVEISANEGLPDGMTVDEEGYVWTALWFGSRLKRFAPNGNLDRELFFPVTQTSSVTFAGPGLEDIYITSAGAPAAGSLAPPGLDRTAPRGGGLYRVRVPGMRGRQAFRSRLRFA